MPCERVSHPHQEFPSAHQGGQDRLRAIYKEWLRVGLPLPEEQIESITQGDFDTAGWHEKSEEERQVYQTQLEQQIAAVTAHNAYLRGDAAWPFTQNHEGTSSTE